MGDFDDLFDRPIPRSVVEEYLYELDKLAAESMHAVRKRGKTQLRNAGLGALGGAALLTGAGRALGSKTIRDSAMDALTGSGIGMTAGGLYNLHKHEREKAKKAELDKEALSTSFMQRAAEGAHPERLQAVRNSALSKAHRLATQAGEKTIGQAKAYRSQHRLANAAEDALSKKAVSTEWVTNAARAAGRAATPSRLGEVAERSMKGVLGAAKTQGPLRQGHLDKRMALRNALLGTQNRLSSPPPAAFKAASQVGDLYLAARQHRLATKIADVVEALQAAPMAPQEPTAEQVMLQEQQGLLQQTAHENLVLRDELEQHKTLVEQHAAEAEQASAMAQQTQEQLQQAEQAAQEQQMMAEESLMMAQEQAQSAQMEAQQQAAEAAAQADGKMRLSIRLQQIRQQLADMASQDPVTEEGEQADPIMTANQQGGMDPMADPAAAEAAAQQGAAPPEAAAQPQQAQAQPPAKPEQPKEKKEEGSKAPKTEIKIGAVKLVDKAKGIRRVGELLTGSRADKLLAHQPRSIRGKLETVRELNREHAKIKATRLGAALGVGTTGTVIGARHQQKKREKTAVDKAQGIKRVGELLKGTRLAAMRTAPLKEGLGNQFRDAGEVLKEHAKVVGARTGAGVVGGGTALGGGIAAGSAIKNRNKEAAPTDLSKAKGIRRIGQLLTGSRKRKLIDASTHTIERANKARKIEMPASAKVDFRKGAIDARSDTRSRRLLAEVGAEGSNVAAARSGAAVGTGALGGAGYMASKGRKKEATEEQVRRDARRAAGRASALPGAAAGALGGYLGSRGGWKAPAAGALLGAAAGTAQGRASFDKRELANDLHMERALTKGRRDRFDKAIEKKASVELTEDDYAKLFGL